MKRTAIAAVVAASALWGCGRLATPEAEVGRLCQQVQGFAVVDLPREAGRVVLKAQQALTVDDLRGVELDSEPPQLAAPAKPYDPRMTDAFPPGQAPYVARGIRPFRFRRFTNEFSYGGWHNFAMQDYAQAHGFGVLFPYNRGIADCGHLPAGTRWLRWGGFVNWHKWLEEHGIPKGRYDALAGMDVPGILASEGVFKPEAGYDFLMIDMEHGVLSPEKLREQPWYPGNAEAQEAFEKRYYDGYAATYTGPVRAARRAGWRTVSLYGWQPFARTFWGLEKVKLDPATHWAWSRFGKAIYEAVDIVNPSVYCFYWTPKNVAYVLGNIDLNVRLVRSMARRKPVRPYYWTLLHGGGGGKRWWSQQPIRDEDVRAMAALSFFAGIDGIVLWNWSGTGDHHVPMVKSDADAIVGEAFDAPPAKDAKAKPERFSRYDALHILDVGKEGTVTFQRIDKAAGRPAKGSPVCSMAKDDLVRQLRAASEPVAAMIEGLALVRPIEGLLRDGEVKTDCSMQQCYADDLPIVRRVKLGRWHVLATYDPLWQERGEPSQVVLEDFDGVEGLTLALPADAETRVFILREP